MDLTMGDLAGPLLALIAAVTTLLHLVTTALAIVKVKKPKPRATQDLRRVPVTIIRPVCGLDDVEMETLASTFTLDHDALDIIFCVASERDPAVPYLRRLIEESGHTRATLLIADDRPTANPKLNNIAKGWRAAETPWIIMADSNVLMPPLYVTDLLSSWEEDTGLVCSPPVGAAPHGFWAEVECAFLNAYQARWQLSADAMGFAFAQGKSMLWRKEDLDKAGGIIALGNESAEDAAATKIVRRSGHRVRLVDRPFPQLIGARTMRQVWDRQVRWARLRRATFLPYYLPECGTGSLLPTLAAAAAAAHEGADPIVAIAMVQAMWLSADALLNRAAGWHLSWVSPFAWIVRDVTLPLIWIAGFYSNTFTWRGNAMSVSPERT